MSRFISLTKLSYLSSFYKNVTLLHSKFTYEKDQQLFHNTHKKLVGYVWSRVSGLQSFPPLTTRLRGFRLGLRDRKVIK